jgi:hypothetical protein
MKRQDFRFSHRMRVRWVEVDMQKIVFNGHYLMYFDTAVTDYWRNLAMPYADTMHQLGAICSSKRPASSTTRVPRWTTFFKSACAATAWATRP